MNLRDNFSKYFLLSIFALIPTVAILFFTLGYFKKYEQQLEQNKKQILGAISKTATSQNTLKSLQYKELSPDKSQEIIVYKLKFDPALYNDYYRDYFPNNTVIAVRNIKTQDEDYLFTGEERTGNPHWLGNNNVFFTAYCGTSCQGIYLIDVRDKETYTGVLSYISSDKKGAWQTHFKDWFGQEFVFAGLVDKIRSEMIDSDIYLIFKMQDDEGNSVGEKRFLFTGKKLVEE